MTASEVRMILDEYGIFVSMPGAFMFGFPDRHLVPFEEMERKARVYDNFNTQASARIREAICACNDCCPK